MVPEKTLSVQLADLFWFAEENFSRAGAFFSTPQDEKTLIAALAAGWKSHLGRPMATEMNEDERKEAHKRLTADWQRLKDSPISAESEAIKTEDGSQVNISPLEMLKAFESIYVDSKGKIRVPAYKGASCFRRASVLLKANTVRMKQGKEVISSMPIILKTWETPLDQVVECVQENTLKTYGSRNLRDVDIANACRVAFRFGATESRLGTMFGLKRGLAQKYHRMCLLDQKYPNQHIVDRVVNGELEGRLFDKEAVKKVLDTNLPEADMATWLGTPRKNDPKIMSRKDIEALGTQCPVELVKLVCKAVIANDVKLLAGIVAKAAAINAAVEGALKS